METYKVSKVLSYIGLASFTLGNWISSPFFAVSDWSLRQQEKLWGSKNGQTSKIRRNKK